MGAWIETKMEGNLYLWKAVAPCMGAWIETGVRGDDGTTHKSHPVWVRGLKRPDTGHRVRQVRRTLYGCVD